MQNQQTHTQIQKAQPLVTFIVTYYNLPIPMLCECINSILALSLSADEREIIVFDDGSESSPMNGLMQYGTDIIYVRQQHQGVSVARNNALYMAHGQYIQFVDGDDYLIKEPYECCLNLIRNNLDVEVIIFDFTQDASDTTITHRDIIKTSGTEYMNSHNLQGAIWCKLFRQSVRGQLEFTPNIRYGEDEEFTPQLLIRAEVVYATPFKAYYYRKHQASVIQQKDGSSKERRLDDNLQVIRHLHYLADRMPNNDRLALNRRVAQLTMDYLYNTIMLHQSLSTLNAAIDTLRQDGLFPLPDRDYTAKYTWFRRLSNSSIGRILLLHSLPLLKKER